MVHPARIGAVGIVLALALPGVLAGHGAVDEEDDGVQSPASPVRFYETEADCAVPGSEVPKCASLSSIQPKGWHPRRVEYARVGDGDEYLLPNSPSAVAPLRLVQGHESTAALPGSAIDLRVAGTDAGPDWRKEALDIAVLEHGSPARIDALALVGNALSAIDRATPTAPDRVALDLVLYRGIGPDPSGRAEGLRTGLASVPRAAGGSPADLRGVDRVFFARHDRAVLVEPGAVHLLGLDPFELLASWTPGGLEPFRASFASHQPYGSRCGEQGVRTIVSADVLGNGTGRHRLALGIVEEFLPYMTTPRFDEATRGGLQPGHDPRPRNQPPCPGDPGFAAQFASDNATGRHSKPWRAIPSLAPHVVLLDLDDGGGTFHLLQHLHRVSSAPGAPPDAHGHFPPEALHHNVKVYLAYNDELRGPSALAALSNLPGGRLAPMAAPRVTAKDLDYDGYDELVVALEWKYEGWIGADWTKERLRDGQAPATRDLPQHPEDRGLTLSPHHPNRGTKLFVLGQEADAPLRLRTKPLEAFTGPDVVYVPNADRIGDRTDGCRRTLLPSDASYVFHRWDSLVAPVHDQLQIAPWEGGHAIFCPGEHYHRPGSATPATALHVYPIDLSAGTLSHRILNGRPTELWEPFVASDVNHDGTAEVFYPTFSTDGGQTWSTPKGDHNDHWKVSTVLAMYSGQSWSMGRPDRSPNDGNWYTLLLTRDQPYRLLGLRETLNHGRELASFKHAAVLTLEHRFRLSFHLNEDYQRSVSGAYERTLAWAQDSRNFDEALKELATGEKLRVRLEAYRFEPVPGQDSLTLASTGKTLYTGAAPLVLRKGDFDQDAPIVRYEGRDSFMGDPDVIAVLAIAPYWRGIGQEKPSTAVGLGSEFCKKHGRSVVLTGSFAFGEGVEFSTGVGVSKETFSFALMATFGYTRSVAEQHWFCAAVRREYREPGTTEYVLFRQVPIDVYRYTWIYHPNASLIGSADYFTVLGRPVNEFWSLDTYSRVLRETQEAAASRVEAGGVPALRRILAQPALDRHALFGVGGTLYRDGDVGSYPSIEAMTTHVRGQTTGFEDHIEKFRKNFASPEYHQKAFARRLAGASSPSDPTPLPLPEEFPRGMFALPDNLEKSGFLESPPAKVTRGSGTSVTGGVDLKRSWVQELSTAFEWGAELEASLNGLRLASRTAVNLGSMQGDELTLTRGFGATIAGLPEEHFDRYRYSFGLAIYPVVLHGGLNPETGLRVTQTFQVLHHYTSDYDPTLRPSADLDVAPALRAPTMGAHTGPVVGLEWTHVPDVPTYEVEIRERSHRVDPAEKAFEVATNRTNLDLGTLGLPTLSGTVFEWRVRAKNGAGLEGDWTPYARFQAFVDPARTTGLAARAGGPPLSWDAAARAKGYEVELTPATGPPTVFVASGTSADLLDHAAGSYTARVRALGDGGTSGAWSDPAPVTIPEVPSGITSLEATVARESVAEYGNVTWRKPPVTWAPASSADRYEVQVGKDREFQTTLAVYFVEAPVFSADQLALGEYYLRVRGLAANRAGPWSETVAVFKDTGESVETPWPGAAALLLILVAVAARGGRGRGGDGSEAR